MKIELSKECLGNTLESTNLSVGERYEGKVRDSYTQGNRRLLVATDRLSCFDVVLTTVPYKGQVLTQLAADWFTLTQDITPNHILDIPDPNVILVQNCEIVPIEVVIRNYLTGSAWRDYQAGNAISGIHLPEGLTEFAKLPETIITPSTKEEKGKHDAPISESELLKRGIVEKKIWDEIREKAFALFSLGTEVAAKQGLLLVDTKYEFGLIDGKVVLADEIHTLDSSRYWTKDSYEKTLRTGTEPVMLDKEPVRRWLLEQGYKGDGTPPAFSNDYRLSLSKHYIESYAQILGKQIDLNIEDPNSRISSKEKDLANLLEN